MIEQRTVDAEEELKRAEHLVYVTLKYTRTVDVIKNALLKLVSAINYKADEVILYAKEKNKLKIIPTAPSAKCEALEKVFSNDKEVKDLIDFYFKLKKILASDYKGVEEYRKNVAFATKNELINIERLKEYTKKTQSYLNHLNALMEKK
ncbi:hypothetical protein HY643_04745 [Candidatus Woesearchaeota archaeon]|nr:hypothetical protein [Candidatus Woesearchaeota archaeon]